MGRATHESIVLDSLVAISIHALREEGDSIKVELGHDIIIFLSTPSVRRATIGLRCVGVFLGISIHALREEGDITTTGPKFMLSDFYPRPP